MYETSIYFIAPNLSRWEIRCGGALLRCGTAATRAAAETHANALELALAGAPSAEGMTTKTTRLTVDLGTLARTRRRARVTFPCVVGFVAGCAAGAVLKGHSGPWALVLPVALAAIIVSLRELRSDGHTTQPLLTCFRCTDNRRE
jgi:hypothetical protein